MGCACGQEPEDINLLPEPSSPSRVVPVLIGLGILGIFWLARRTARRARRNSPPRGRRAWAGGRFIRPRRRPRRR